MEDQAGCPIKAAVSVIGGKWKTGILYRLAERPYRFGELNRAMSWIDGGLGLGLPECGPTRFLQMLSIW